MSVTTVKKVIRKWREGVNWRVKVTTHTPTPGGHVGFSSPEEGGAVVGRDVALGVGAWGESD